MSGNLVGRPMEILLVEDNLEDARTTMEALHHGNVKCRVSLVCDGEEALTFLHHDGVFARAPRPDLILLDMELPKKGGREVLTEVRGDEQLQSIPVVVLTGSLVHKTVLQGDGLHIDGFLAKPVSLEEFIRVVRSLRQSWMAEVILPPAD
jgi:chemotaxis family two-component system response regulator Rcp1